MCVTWCIHLDMCVTWCIHLDVCVTRCIHQIPSLYAHSFTSSKKKSYIRIPLHMDAYLPVFLGRTLRTNSSMRGALLCVLGSFGHWNGHMCLKWSCLLGTEMGMFVIQLWCLFRKPNASRLQSSSLSLHACVAHTLVCWAFLEATLLTWGEGASR